MVNAVAQLSTLYAISFMAFILPILSHLKETSLERVFHDLRALQLAVHRTLIGLSDLVRPCFPFS